MSFLLNAFLPISHDSFSFFIFIKNFVIKIQISWCSSSDKKLTKKQPKASSNRLHQNVSTPKYSTFWFYLRIPVITTVYAISNRTEIQQFESPQNQDQNSNSINFITDFCYLSVAQSYRCNPSIAIVLSFLPKSRNPSQRIHEILNLYIQSLNRLRQLKEVNKLLYIFKQFLP